MTGHILWTPDRDPDEAPEDLRAQEQRHVLSRRSLLRVGAGGAAAAALYAGGARLSGPLAKRGLASADGLVDAGSLELSDSVYTEVFPTSPLILNPFNDTLFIPPALRPDINFANWKQPPGPGLGQQNSLGNEQHQKWCDSVPGSHAEPLVYPIDVKVAAHSFTTSPVLPINSSGLPTVSFDVTGQQYAAGVQRYLPPSTIYGFNGTFPGPRINAEYGQPAIVRFHNLLHLNPLNLDRQDFGAPDGSFLTHLHNAHTAPESDGNPHYSMTRGPKWHGYRPGDWVDNMYLNWPAGNDSREKQSFFWFHDHRMDHTGANVYKGMVGIYPIYDREPLFRNGVNLGGTDMGDERQGLRLPGVRTENGDGSFDVDYDVPLVFYDTRLDDGVTQHHDIHDSLYPLAGNPRTHPEWWGKTFFKHFPNHGFVGDIFTVNGTAYPVMHVKRRKYRFRFLDASVSRIYEFALMSSTKGPKAAKDLGYTGDELQGQYRIPDGQQCMKMLQIASDGGLLPFAVTRNSFELWPAKRREMVIDFTKYQDGSGTKKGDVIYLTNIMKMTTGRMWDNSSRFGLDPNYKIPMIAFVIDDDAMAPDDSRVKDGDPLRELPPLPSNWQSLMANRTIFEVQRGGLGGETEWLINGQAFDPTQNITSKQNPSGKTPKAEQKMNSFNLWELRNGGGGWVHPFHLHMEEHRTVLRNGKDVTGRGASPGRPDDYSREDLIALDPGESVVVYRGFRDFVGPYVAHCHNLMHEDHAMMFGWEITS